jgi:bifunctional non-homologous end joining protein LigD
MSLSTYNKKRSFDETPEPKGVVEKRAHAKLMFVVQKHHASHLHYDFRLELDGALKSWAVPKGPSLRPSDKRLAMAVEDHPISYGHFEGTIPKGNYGAGEVIVWDIGTYESADGTPLKSQFEKGRMKIRLHGKKLRGDYSLSRMKDNQWLLIKKQDSFACEEDITLQTNSVLSKRSIANLAPKTEKKRPKKITKRDAMPSSIKPMLATLVQKPFDSADWEYEIKWDGYRAIAIVSDGGAKLYSRNNIEFKKYPSITESLSQLPHEAVLDGEVIAVDTEGRASFQMLQQLDVSTQLLYYAFDLLYLDGIDLQDKPLFERRDLLKSIIPAKGAIKYSDSIIEKGTEFFTEVQKQGLEGIIAKNRTSTYRQGERSKQWLKIKTHQRQEAVIVGYTEPRGSRKQFGALVLGVYKDDELIYIGHTGGGFNDASLKELRKKLNPLIQKTSPFTVVPKTNMPVTWVKPTLVCEVKFTEWTKDGQMRHPIFLGLRIDKKAREVVKEVPADKEKKSTVLPRGIFTHVDKVYWPQEGITKGDLIAYYADIAKTMLPYLKDRPQNLNRHPNGIVKKGFFQKDFKMEDAPAFIETAHIFSESNNAFIDYLVCNNKETLLYMANLGCIEINPWNSRLKHLENPDYMVLDLDPGTNSFEEVIQVALVVHRVLNESCEKNYCKTSGKTGLHIFVPLKAKYPYEQVRQFAELIAKIVHRELPEITSLERSPAKRKDKIYIDYLQNRYGQTLSAPYSVRPAPGAPVSTPLKWGEVKKGLRPEDFTIFTIFDRLEAYGDLWKPVITESVDLKKAIKCLEQAADI